MGNVISGGFKHWRQHWAAKNTLNWMFVFLQCGQTSCGIRITSSKELAYDWWGSRSILGAEDIWGHGRRKWVKSSTSVEQSSYTTIFKVLMYCRRVPSLARPPRNLSWTTISFTTNESDVVWRMGYRCTKDQKDGLKNLRESSWAISPNQTKFCLSSLLGADDMQ